MAHQPLRLHGPLEPASVDVGIETVGGVRVLGQTLTPDDSEGTINTVLPETTVVFCNAGVNGADDFIVLPSLLTVPQGHTITVYTNAAGMEIRTPASSAQEINSEDCDGTKEYTVAAGPEIHIFRKISDSIGWMGQGFTAIGAVVTAIVPDA